MFLSELKVKVIRGTGDRELLDSLLYENRKGMMMVVPKGFRTNYASIPKFLRWFIDQDGPDIRDISVVHDFLYSKENIYLVNRRQADKILFQGMVDQGLKNIGARALMGDRFGLATRLWMEFSVARLYIKAALVWLAVRLFGGLRHRATSPAPAKPQEENEMEQVTFSFYAVTLAAVLLIFVPMAMSGCSVTTLAKAKAGQYVQAYCGQTPAERAAFRALINDSIHPNTITLECIDDGRH